MWFRVVRDGGLAVGNRRRGEGAVGDYVVQKGKVGGEREGQILTPDSHGQS